MGNAPKPLRKAPEDTAYPANKALGKAVWIKHRFRRDAPTNTMGKELNKSGRMVIKTVSLISTNKPDIKTSFFKVIQAWIFYFWNHVVVRWNIKTLKASLALITWALDLALSRYTHVLKPMTYKTLLLTLINTAATFLHATWRLHAIAIMRIIDKSWVIRKDSWSFLL